MYKLLILLSLVVVVVQEPSLPEPVEPSPPIQPQPIWYK